MKKNRRLTGIAAALAWIAMTACGDLASHKISLGEADGSFGDRGSYDDSGSPPSQNGGAGTLTAADWDDNLNFDHYLDYLTAFDVEYPEPPLPALPANDRIQVEIKDNLGLGARNATVTVRDSSGNILATLPTGSDGRTLYFPSLDGAAESYLVEATLGAMTAQATFASDATAWSLQLDGSAASAAAPGLDLAFIVDVTGSMGDELQYLQTELEWVVAQIAANHAQLDLRLGLVAYRDIGDAFEVRSTPFTTTTDFDQFFAALRLLRAGGGGDYPESVAEGLHAALDLEWRDTDTVRVAFLVGDAPPQAGRQLSTAAGAIRARDRAIRIYPIAASGVSRVAEWAFRQLAQFTSARYLFLTDDSGIGNTHEEPHVPCYLVQKLNDLMLRVVESELMGMWIYPAAEEIIRTAGEPADGQCLVDEQTYYY
ncbi:MAG: vWA domain-containing protein [Myxococcota bacterium]